MANNGIQNHGDEWDKQRREDSKRRKGSIGWSNKVHNCLRNAQKMFLQMRLHGGGKCFTKKKKNNFTLYWDSLIHLYLLKYVDSVT